MSRNVAKSEAIQLEILTVVGRFGWMRIKEISLLIWNETAEDRALVYAYKFIKKLEAMQLVHLEKLPESAGTVVLLKIKGVAYLRNNHVEVTKVKVEGDKWIAPSTWKHDNLTSGLFVAIMNRKNLVVDNARYFTDRECKRMIPKSTNPILDYNGSIKSPDLIIETRLGILAIEIERSSKTGDGNKGTLVETLIKTNVYNAPYKYKSLEPNVVVIAYDIDQTIERVGKDKKLHHGKNIFFTVQKDLKKYNAKEIRVLIFEMTVRNFGVQSFRIIDEVLPVDEVHDYFKSDAYLYGHSNKEVLRWLFPKQFIEYH